MSIADHYGDGQVEREDMCQAVATWQALLNDESLIAERFHEYDTDQSGGLNETQLAEVLKDLNGGVAVSTEEVKQVFSQADGKGPKKLEDGVINEAELKVAVAVRSQTFRSRRFLLSDFFCSRCGTAVRARRRHRSPRPCARSYSAAAEMCAPRAALCLRIQAGAELE